MDFRVGNVFQPQEGMSDCVEDNKNSESGWTMYLEQSRDSWGTTHSMIRFPEAASKVNSGNCLSRQPNETSCDILLACEDSSMASDASSGPQHHLELNQQTSFSNGNVKPASCPLMTAFDISARPTTNKRRRMGVCHHDPSLLEDTASSPVHSPKSGHTPGEVHIKENFGSTDCISDFEAEAVNRRLELLQSLLPDGAKICREEALGVAIEYINALEQTIKELETQARLMCENGEGLCLIPYSVVEGAI
eukprot:Gb_09372 [translate_table: standard]